MARSRVAENGPPSAPSSSAAGAPAAPDPPSQPVAAPTAAPAAPVAPAAPGKLTLIGAGHVFRIEDEIHGAIHAIRPDIVFVELDPGRLQVLVQRSQGITPQQDPNVGRVARGLQRFQEQVAGLYGADVGSEMLAAVNAGHEVGARVALIDPPAQDTLRRVVAELTWREKVRGVGEAVRAGWNGLLGGSKREDIDHEIQRYQDDPEAALSELHDTFPTVHRIVIAERDQLMGRRIRALLAGARHGVAVIGDGHVGGVLRELDGIEVEVFRLDDVRGGKLPKAAMATGTGSQASFGFDART